MRVVIDKYIPFIQGVLEPYASEVIYATPEKIDSTLVRDADALLVRTRTKVNESLLGESRCRFVATATIGMDHIDSEWCRKAGITAVNAPGCNAPAVAQYVLASLSRLNIRKPEDSTLAVVGVGHIGSIVSRWALGLGYNVLHVDPLRAVKEPDKRWYTLDEIARLADVITFHTPLTQSGPYPTRHLADTKFFGNLGRTPIVINSSRGAVVDNDALLDAIRSGKISHAVVDVWKGEPNINLDLLAAADIATPHIAGYSLDGKIRATQMVLDALCRHFNLPALKADAPEAAQVPETVSLRQVLDSYDPFADTLLMRKAISNSFDTASTFEQLRDNYNLRKEITSL